MPALPVGIRRTVDVSPRLQARQKFRDHQTIETAVDILAARFTEAVDEAMNAYARQKYVQASTRPSWLVS
jgi:hypothetical protein